MRPATALSATALAIAVLGSTPVGEAARELVIPAKSVGAAQLKADAVTSTKVKNGSLLAADFKPKQLPAGSAGVAGPTGPKGDKGDKGDRGESATRLWVTVGDNGSINRQGGGASASRGGLGQYFVTFDRDVSRCAWLATARIGFARVREAPSPRSVIVELSDSGPTDGAFHLGVFC